MNASVKRLMRYMGKDIFAFLLVTVLAITSNILIFIGPRILGQATDMIISGVQSISAGTGGIDFPRIAHILLFLAGLYGLSCVFGLLQNHVMAGITASLSYRLRKDLSEKMHRLPLSYFDRTLRGDVLSRITNDVDTLVQSLNQGLIQILTSVISLVGIIIMMFMISWQLTLIALCVIPLFAVLISIISKKSSVHFKNQQERLGDVNSLVEEMLGSHTLVKAFNGEEASLEKFDKNNISLYNSAWKANFFSGLMMPVIFIIGNIGNVVICIAGGYYALKGALTIGGIQAFLQYTRSFLQPITQTANISNVFQQITASAERVFEFLNETEESADADAAKKPSEERVESSPLVHFDHVRFGYDREKMIINDFSADIKRGQKIAIVGPSGAGKTTLVKLLMRFYDVSGGAILLGGRDIRSFSRKELRSVFGMVLQDTWLFSGSIAGNIRYGNPEACDEEVRQAARTAQADRFVRTLPEEYDLVLNEESGNISQGQKQLLTIARVVLADPEILILDEATSNIDTHTELLIQQAMDNLMKGRTSFVIAHRLSTIRNADLILVMNNGDIVEQGGHAELLAKKGVYASLYNSQFSPE
ncbi:MAG: ABC transporter ATP-binding protein/permease [Spirochaetaceae bacterium]|jgi:ATP-binding cassette subfamily B protein|nr:ABC transporter ATP-binding protein/permease [Spirochaetaceae bacterium]